jgi:DNA polymerase elongation subunit (family B)
MLEDTYLTLYLDLYSDVSDLDFTSLYPSIIKSLNLGIETLMGRIVTKTITNNTIHLSNLNNVTQKKKFIYKN